MLESAVSWLVTSIARLPLDSQWGVVVHYFLYDSIKLVVLLLLMTLLMGVVRHYLPTERIRDLLAGRGRALLAYPLAALFGAVTPFCSCSSIPLFIGFVSAGIPLGVTFAFLITSPLVNEVALVLFVGLFGWKVTMLYAGLGVLLGIVGGVILGRLRLERYVDQRIMLTDTPRAAGVPRAPLGDALPHISRDALQIVKRVLPFILIGIAVGALVHGFVPADAFARYFTSHALLAVPTAVVLGIPLYANATSVLPIVSALIEKGVPFGVALAFMMATVGLSLPEAILLKRVLRVRALATYFGVVALGMMFVGYIFLAIV